MTRLDPAEEASELARENERLRTAIDALDAHCRALDAGLGASTLLHKAETYDLACKALGLAACISNRDRLLTAIEYAVERRDEADAQRDKAERAEKDAATACRRMREQKAELRAENERLRGLLGECAAELAESRATSTRRTGSEATELETKIAKELGK